MTIVNHNLDINKYSLDELLGLFNLSYKIDFESMKNAKKKVLSVHPDKSRLPPEYFIFYKQAYEVVFRFYQEQNDNSRKSIVRLERRKNLWNRRRRNTNHFHF